MSFDLNVLGKYDDVGMVKLDKPLKRKGTSKIMIQFKKR